MAQSGPSALSNLTENQLLFWIGYKLQPDVPLEPHSIRFAFRIDGEIDPHHFQRAIQKLLDEADALRTVIKEIDMVPRRKIAERLPFTVAHLRFSDDPEPEKAFQRWVDSKRQTSVSTDAPFDTALIELGPTSFIWYLALHHMIGDARSVSLIARHVADYYELSLADRLETAPPLPKYEDYITYERTHRSSEVYLKAASYWQKKLHDSRRMIRRTTTARVPRPAGTDYIDTSLARFRTERISHDLGPERSAALNALLKREGFLSPAILFSAVLFVYMSHHAPRAHAPHKIGALFSNRPERFLHTIGLFVSTCPMQIQTVEDETFLSFARRVQVETILTSQHQHYPVQNPVHQRHFDVLFNYLNVKFPSFGARKMRAELIRSGYSTNPLSVHVRDFDGVGRFTVDFEFLCEEYPLERRGEAMAYILRVIEAVLEDPGRTVDALVAM